VRCEAARALQISRRGQDGPRFKLRLEVVPRSPRGPCAARRRRLRRRPDTAASFPARYRRREAGVQPDRRIDVAERLLEEVEAQEVSPANSQASALSPRSATLCTRARPSRRTARVDQRGSQGPGQVEILGVSRLERRENGDASASWPWRSRQSAEQHGHLEIARNRRRAAAELSRWHAGGRLSCNRQAPGSAAGLDGPVPEPARPRYCAMASRIAQVSQGGARDWRAPRARPAGA